MEKCTIMNVAEAKAKLSELMERAERGENVVIARKGKAIVRLVSVMSEPMVKPDRANLFGLYDHLGPVPQSALEPEPLDAWFSEQPIPGVEPFAEKVAEPAKLFDSDN